jgi:hypothetical protein
VTKLFQNRQDRYGIICSANLGPTRGLVYVANVVYITNSTYYKKLYLLDRDT